jgi:hypothetical protein
MEKAKSTPQTFVPIKKVEKPVEKVVEPVEIIQEKV